MAGRFTAKRKEDDGEPTYPRLNAKQLGEISELFVKYKSINRILKHWNAVNLDSEGNITGICDFVDWYGKSDENKKKYENYEPLKGIKYMGMGFVTFQPYSWCSEWISSWTLWIQREAERGDRQALSFMKKGDIHIGGVAL